MGNVGLRWDHPDGKLWAEGVVTVAEEQDRLSSSDRADNQRIPPGGTPGYTVLTLRGGWQVYRDLKLSLALENVTDEDYRIHGSGLNEPGRNFVLAADWKF
jgi:hemoglobin/transferrin/lactoferrin receptor protein